MEVYIEEGQVGASHVATFQGLGGGKAWELIDGKMRARRVMTPAAPRFLGAEGFMRRRQVVGFIPDIEGFLVLGADFCPHQ